MSDDTATTNTPPSAPVPGGTGTTTRDQHRRNTAEQEAIEDSEKATHEHKKKDRETFKGKIEKMDGNVFQLPEEGRKGNQFTLTLEALANYATIEYDHAKDLRPLFESPCSKAKLKEPPDLPPMSSDGVTRVPREHRKYIEWKFECESFNTRTTTLASNQHKLFTVTLLQCSQSVKNKVEATVNAKAAIFNCRQCQAQSTPDYYDTFKELVSILESYGGQLHDPDTAAPESAADIFVHLTPDERNIYARSILCRIVPPQRRRSTL
jgi:hypothetical protein